MLRRRKFHADGIRFECQDCGQCCLSRNEYAYVYITAKDRKRIADFLNVSTREFTENYTAITDGLLHVRDPEQDCLFIENGRCGVYDARPQQCRSWPFWPENMNKKIWEREIASYCPGVGKGRLYSREEIEEIIEKEKKSFDL